MRKPVFYSTDGVATELHITRDHLLYLLAQGGCPQPQKVAGRRTFFQSDVDAIRKWIETREAPVGRPKGKP